MNNETEVIDDIDIESEIPSDEPPPSGDRQVSASEEVSEDVLGDTQLGQDLGQLITEIRRDEENFQQSGEAADSALETDPFDPNNFSLDTSFNSPESQPVTPSAVESQGQEEVSRSSLAEKASDSLSAETEALVSAATLAGSESPESDDAASAIAELVSEIETALQRFAQAERLRADQRIAEREAQVAEQYRKARNLADKVAKQKAQIQEAKKELKAKLEVADRLHIEFDGIRQVLNGKLGLLDQLEKEAEAAE